MTVHCWSFDPGMQSGWCHLSVHEDGEIGIFDCGEVDLIQLGDMLYDNQSLKAAVSKRDIFETVFVVEKFIMQSKITQAPWSLEATGLIRYFAAVYHIPLDDVQKPSEVKNLITNDVIKKAGLWVPSKDGHQMDAVRHGLYWLIVKRKFLTELLRK